ncbi:MAG: tRNA (adenosine(37)-N6)-threonylcarbamoyltransferase complex ATPase subunit type 1 TsaE, partial [Candidatus Eisenbacteria bacterium]|nr:tRNA (adenosine(37)-N6)-threonylcarbamoyltransferase complex ATPase subunit type 1 TsaE [Candidatus Eisenbacteria bacterium]
LGAELAPALETGDVIALTGPLGAGKTRFVTGLARGLEARARVRSPSYTLVNEYRGRVRLVHLDLYRVEAPEIEALGLPELIERGALVVEWGEKLPGSLRALALVIEFETVGEGARALTAGAAAGRGLALLEAWRTAEDLA